MAEENAATSDRELVADETPVVASPKKPGVHAVAQPVTALAGNRLLASPPVQTVTAVPPPRATEPVQEQAVAPPPPPAPAQGAPKPPGAVLSEIEPAVTGANAPPRRVILELSDIAFKLVPSSGFAVYLASADDVAAGRRGTFIGLLDLFGVTHGHVAGMEGMTAVQRFDVTRLVAREGLALTLRVEPYDLLVSKRGASGPKRSDSVKIGKVRFVEVA
jgi:hypothetical protein